jgi:hypothetical protein
MTKERKYIDFKLELRDLDTAADTFKVAVLPSAGVGDTRDAVSVPYGYAELEYPLKDLDRKALELEDLIALGQALANRLLPEGPVRDLYKQAVNQAGQDGGVRLRLIIRSLALAQLPWEYTFDPTAAEKTRDHFLALNPQISMVRYESQPAPPPALAVRDPEQLRLVALSANVANMRQLKLDVEKRVVEEALANFDVDGVTITHPPFIENATPDDLTAALQRGVDLFHFAGHGLFEQQDVDPQTNEPIGEGKIVLVKDKQTRERFLLGAKDLGTYLQQAGVRLAVLGACRSGERDKVQPWTGVAPALLEKGVPAVVGMQYEVVDDAAVAFSKAFYTALAAGLSVDEAVWSGRQAMTMVTTLNPDKNVEWGVPVLYMRSPDGVIFPRLAERPSPTAERIRLEAKAVIEAVEKGAAVVVQELEGVSGNVTATSDARVGVVRGTFVGQKVTFGKKDKQEEDQDAN